MSAGYPFVDHTDRGTRSTASRCGHCIGGCPLCDFINALRGFAETILRAKSEPMSSLADLAKALEGAAPSDQARHPPWPSDRAPAFGDHVPRLHVAARPRPVLRLRRPHARGQGLR